MADSALVCCALAGQNREGRGLGIVASDNMELAMEQCSGCYRAMSRHGVAARPREGPGMQLRGIARRRETEVPGLLSIRRYVQQRCFCRPARPGSRGGQVWEIAADFVDFRTRIIIKEIVR